MMPHGGIDLEAHPISNKGEGAVFQNPLAGRPKPGKPSPAWVDCVDPQR